MDDHRRQNAGVSPSWKYWNERWEFPDAPEPCWAIRGDTVINVGHLRVPDLAPERILHFQRVPHPQSLRSRLASGRW
jgi:hypothetical protein